MLKPISTPNCTTNSISPLRFSAFGSVATELFIIIKPMRKARVGRNVQGQIFILPYCILYYTVYCDGFSVIHKSLCSYSQSSTLQTKEFWRVFMFRDYKVLPGECWAFFAPVLLYLSRILTKYRTDISSLAL
jgi:hypothetical protein